jgi:glutathione peroxidase
MKTIEKAKTVADKKATTSPSLYEIEINALDGKPIDMANFKDKHLLFVNVASECGFTKQYKELQELSDRYTESLVVIGVPCNQFGRQEPGNASEIQTFCERNFGATFLLTEKIEVKGSKQHPLYQWLTKKEQNGRKSSSVKWNFQKYLIDKEGKLVDYYFSVTKPMSSKITKHL